MSILNHDFCTELAKHVSDLTNSGRKDLDGTIMKKLKNICKNGDNYVEHAYHLIMSQMQKEHSEVRYTALLIVDELFCRSHKFRELLLSDFQLFLELTAETDSDEPLPPPKSAAKDLKIKTIQLVQKWHDQFKDGYKRLILGYNFLKDCKKVDFSDIEARSEAERRRQESLRRHQEHVMKTKVELTQKEMLEMTPEIENVVAQMKSCFSLLLPHPDELFPETEMEEANKSSELSTMSEPTGTSEEDAFLRAHGLTNRKCGIQIEIPPTTKMKVEVNEDTEAIIENLQDLRHQVQTQFLPMLNKWLKVYTKASSNDMLKKLIDMKQALQKELEKFNELKVPNKGINSGVRMNDSDNDDFEEVQEKEGYEEKVASYPVKIEECEDTVKQVPVPSPSKRWKISNRSPEELKDPTTMMANLQALANKIAIHSKSDLESAPSTSSEYREMPGNSRKASLLAKAPRRPYDIDLYHWEDKKLEPPTFVKFDSLHRFWQPTENTLVESQCQEGIALLRKRVIEYTGEFVPVKWMCRVPLPSGKLCPRQDRNKCPFHGPVIGRNKLGVPTNPEDVKRFKLEKPSTSGEEPVPDWQDPVLLQELEAATGINLKMPNKRKGKGKKSKKSSDLTDIKKIQNTTRRRLEKKVFNKMSVRRVAQTLDAVDSKRIADKFGNQWNYAFNT